MKLSKFLASAALSLALLAGPVSAAEFVVIYKGTVYDSIFVGLGANTFGNNGASLDGAAFEARFEVDTSVPGVNFLSDSNAALYVANGLNAPFFQTASITINGVTMHLPTVGIPNYNLDNRFLRFAPPNGDQISNAVNYRRTTPGPQFLRQNDNLEGTVYSISSGLWPTNNLTTPFEYTLNPGDGSNTSSGLGSGFVFDRILLNGQQELVAGALTVTSVSMNFSGVTAAVPEPATWAMMIIGFGMVGAGMRRKAKVQVTYA